MTDSKCRHGRKLCSECIHVGDSAKRSYDIVRSYATFVDKDELRGKWVALRLADGSSDGTLYDSKRDAVRHQLDEQICAYFSYRNSINGFQNVKDAAVWLEFHRMAYDSGFRLIDPDDASGGKDVIMPITMEQLMAQIRGTS